MKKIITLFLWLFHLSVYPQTFLVTGPDNNTSTMNWGVKIIDNLVATYSTTVNYNDSIPYVGFNATKYDFNGNMVVDTFIGNMNITVVPAFAATYSNGYFGIAGQVRYPLSLAPYKTSALLLHKDFVKSFPIAVDNEQEDNTAFSNYVFMEKPNKIIVIKNAQLSANLSTVKCRIYVLDTIGNILQQKEFIQTGKWCQSYRIHRFENNYYLVINCQQNNALNDPTNLVIHKLDTLFNILNTYQTFNGRYYNANTTAVFPNGDFVVGGVYSDAFTPPDNLWQQKYLAKYDKNLNLIWFKKFGVRTLSTSVNKLIITSEGNIVGVGKEDLTPDSAWFHKTGCIFKFSPDGDSLWMHNYTGVFSADYGALNDLVDVDEVPGGGFVACGNGVGLVPYTLRGWVIKVDADGCLNPGCITAIEKRDNTKIIRIYPNPANTYLTIENQSFESALTVQIFNITGEKVLDERLNNLNNQKVATGHLNNGMYLLRIFNDENKLIHSEKITIVH
jgi:hypothetical protein